MIVIISVLGVKGAIKMRSEKDVSFPVILFIVSMAPFIVNQLARVFFAFIPFFVLFMATGLESISKRNRYGILIITSILVLGSSYGYSYTYRNILDEYNPFFNQMRTEIPEGSNVIVPQPSAIPFFIYHTGRKVLRIDMPGGIPRIDPENFQQIFEENHIDYVCCSSLHWDSQSDEDKKICEILKTNTPIIEYNKGDIWGLCWNAQST